MKKILTGLLVIVFFWIAAGPVKATQQVDLYLFYSKSCPHCAAEEEFLSELVNKYDWLSVKKYEISISENQKLLGQVENELNTKLTGVPFSVVCGEYFTGFAETTSFKNNLEKSLIDFHEGRCNDPIKKFLPTQSAQDVAQIQTPEPQPADVDSPIEKESVSLPLIGELQIKDLSLPVFTFVVALLDGFNPCAMWVLIFLISLLLGMKDKFKMWTLGTAFILASGFMYFMFLAAWLHLFLFLGFIKWVKVGIGLFALAAGGYYLYDYQTNKTGGCKVTGGEKRKKVFEQLKSVTQNKNFLLALIGIILLAFAVNLVELICSAGLPAVYTEVLTLTPMAKWKYYLYLVFYIIVFMLDDLIVYIIAMKTLHAVGISGKYSRFSHLVGGIVMLLIGLAMLFKPELLMFG